MARIREVLRLADRRRNRPPELEPPPRAYEPTEELSIATEPTEEIPFIEVGDRNAPPQGSPSVLAVTLRPVSISPKQPEIPNEHPIQARPNSLPGSDSNLAFTGVTFRPWPPEPPALRPARERLVPELIAFHRPDQRASEQYRVVLHQLETQFPEAQPRAILFTASSLVSDTTTVLLNLAITRARQSSSRIVVVDANLRRPALAQRLGLPNEHGLRDVLAAKLSLLRALRDTGIENLHALTAGRAANENHQLLASEEMREVLRQLRNRFDWVFVDAPCWDGRPDQVALGSLCDAVYLVISEDRAESAEVEELLQLIPQQGGALRGCICTQVGTC